MSAIQTDCTTRSVCGSTTNPAEKEKDTTVMHLKGKTRSPLNMYKLVRLRKKKIRQLCISREKLGLRSTYTNLCGSWTRVTVIFRLPRLSVDSRPIYRPRPPLVNMIQVLHLLSKHSLLLRLYIKCYFLKLLCHCL